jgi:hypothetical protein
MDMALSDTLLGLPAGLGAAADEIGSRRRPTGLGCSADGAATALMFHLDRKQHLKLSSMAGQGNISAPLVVSDELMPEIY